MGGAEKMRDNCAIKVWCLISDFNNIRRRNKRQGETMRNGDASDMNIFNNLINELGVEEYLCLGHHSLV